MSLSPNDLKALYSKNYFMGEEYIDYVRDKEVLQLNFEKHIKAIKKLHNFPATHVLEIGCAYGFFGEAFLRHFPDSNYIGFDISTDAVSYGKQSLGLNLSDNDYLTSQLKHSVDAVFMWDVIEHLDNPDLYLQQVSTNSVSGAYLFITTADIEAVLAKIQKRCWRMIHPPTHLHYFSKNTIIQLLNKNGYEIVEITYPPVYRSIRQIFYSLFLLNRNANKLLTAINNKIPIHWAIPLNTFDIMFVIAKKKV